MAWRPPQGSQEGFREGESFRVPMFLSSRVWLWRADWEARMEGPGGRHRGAGGRAEASPAAVECRPDGAWRWVRHGGDGGEGGAENKARAFGLNN